MHLRATKTGSARRRKFGSLIVSPGTLLLTCLIYGMLPFTLAVGIGSTDTTTSDDPLTRNPPQPNVENNYSTDSLLSIKSSRNESNSNSDIPRNYYLYDCPTSCQCEYTTSSQTLEIRCLLPSSSSTRQQLDLSMGIRTLRFRDTLLDNGRSIGSVIPPLRKNTLVELDLETVVIEPKSFFTNSRIFRESDTSLRRLKIRRASLRGNGDVPITTLPAAAIRAVLQPLASLQMLDSLDICDSSNSLATVVLQAMPAVSHLRAVNNSLCEIPYESLTTSYQQYSRIESLDFSQNHITIVPNGLLEGLANLRVLDVSQNRIFHLQEQVFSGLSALHKLNVSHNRIEYVDAGVFTSLPIIETIDLSHNDVVQFFEPYFANNKELTVLNLSKMWTPGTFTTTETGTRSLLEIERLISTLYRVEKLDISNNGMKTIPETLTHAPNLQQVIMQGNPWECTCEDRWILDWILTAKVTVGDSNRLSDTNNMFCKGKTKNGQTATFPFYDYFTKLSTTCVNSNIIAKTPYKYHAIMGKNKQLICHAQKPNWPKITWITPSKRRISPARDIESSVDGTVFPRSLLDPRVSLDGSLLLTNVTGPDYGLYLCIASYEDLNITHYVHLGMDVSVFRDVRQMSILVGWTFSLAFLFLVLIFQLVRWILDRLGIRCMTMPTTKRTRRVRAFFDSMEQHKTSQLDWLRDNYNMQAKKIKDNCFSQLERIRESYTNQSKNLGEIRDYGTQQLHTLRDQYNDQVRKVASYSAHQLCKVRENYVFKRNQVCKFSNHQLLRLRETYKWQAQTLNKILENLPRGLNFDTCRGMGACGRTDSIYLDDFGEEIHCPHTIHPELYHLTSGSQQLHHHLMGFPSGSRADKLEHVSLLIPPEFVSEYKQTESVEEANEQSVEIQEPHNKPQPDTPEREPVISTCQQAEPDECEDNFEDASSSSTPPTVTLSSTPSTLSGSYSSEAPVHPAVPSTPVKTVTNDSAITEDVTDHV